MIQLKVKSFDLPLRDPFTIARSTTTVQPTLVVEAHMDGLVGLGEATTNDYYGASLENMNRMLDEVAPRLAEMKQLENPAEVWRELDPVLSQNRFAQCALDCALWDLYAQQHQLPLYRLWGFDEDAPCPPTCYTLGIDTPEVMLRKMQAFPNWPIYKIKLDHTGLANVRYLRQHTQSIFRVDANCSWQADQILGLAEELAGLNVELIEQPLPAEAYNEMRPLKGKSPLPLMADESCQVEEDVNRCIDCFDAINVKLVKCGGLTPARRMIARAKQNGLKVMVGCMTESSIGISAGVHLLPLLDFADLDGALLLARDIASGIEWRAGHCVMPKRPGLGVQLVA